MDIENDSLKVNRIFNPGLIELVSEIAKKQKKFVYYTSAETALKVIHNQELWFRNATVMNDFSEIAYGLQLIQEVFGGSEGEAFRKAVDGIFSDTIVRAEKLLSEWTFDWQFETYIACVSVHNPEEDTHGRLSMWRAYGDTALVLNNTPMLAVTDLLAVFSIPVLYLSKKGLAEHLAEITTSIEASKEFLLGLGQEHFDECIRRMLFRFAIATKHPGFKEEEEFRLFYRPSERLSPGMTEEIAVLGGVPQKVFKLRLAHAPNIGLFNADIPSLLDRIIIGPTEFSYVSRKAFVTELERQGVDDAISKVVVSDIPLRLE